MFHNLLSLPNPYIKEPMKLTILWEYKYFNAALQHTKKIWRAHFEKPHQKIDKHGAIKCLSILMIYYCCGKYLYIDYTFILYESITLSYCFSLVLYDAHCFCWKEYILCVHHLWIAFCLGPQLNTKSYIQGSVLRLQNLWYPPPKVNFAIDIVQMFKSDWPHIPGMFGWTAGSIPQQKRAI